MNLHLHPFLRRRRPALAVWALAAALLTGPAPAAAQPVPGLSLKPCALRGVEHPALCGTLRRPLDPARPAGPAFDLHVAVLPALARNKKPDPVFFFAGGPGQSAIELAGPVGRLMGRFLNRRDLVLIDQRGTGRSAALPCGFDDAPQRSLRDAADPAAWLPELARCREALQRLPHGDLRFYTTVLAMQDADAVRQALGAAQVNLVGGSYGTRAALEYLRQFPQAVRRVVIDGVAPPDMVLPASFGPDGQAAFDALLAWCRADAACRQAHPQLAERWRALRASLPREVRVAHPYTGREESLQVTPAVLAGLVRGPLYAPQLAAALPAAIEAAAEGRWAPLVGLASTGGGGRAGRLAQGMHFSVVCAEDVPRLTAGAAPDSPDFGDTYAALYREACRDWPRGTVPPDFYRIGVSASPVLLLSGAVDPATPPRHAERVAAALGPQARAVVVPNAGHGVLALPCVRELVYRFVDEERPGVPDAGCLSQLPRPPLFRAPAQEPLR